MPPSDPASGARIPLGPQSALRALWTRSGAILDGAFGLVALVLFLAVISAIPLLNLLSLGYLLEASGRIAKSGRLADGFPGLMGFARAGRAIFCAWILLLPARLLHGMFLDAELIAQGSSQSLALRALLALYLVAASFHFFWALHRGGRWRHFLWPAPLRFLRWLGEDFRTGSPFRGLGEKVRRLRIASFLRVGVLGFAGAALWLALPVAVLFGASLLERPGLAAFVSLVGAILLGAAALLVPFLQTRFARTGRFAEFLRPGSARAAFRRAPLAFLTAVSATLLLALPLYLLKIELAPSELVWIPNLFFVLFAIPARLLLGWAVHRSERRETPRFWLLRWSARVAALPVAAAYVFVVWISQYLSWHGTFGLLEQHAFLVPAPLFGL